MIDLCQKSIQFLLLILTQIINFCPRPQFLQAA